MMGWRIVLSLLPLIFAAEAQNSRVFPGPMNSIELPQCPNGEPPKLDRRGTLIQCLPGAGQHSVCGPVHTCFFSGMNYMCCPTNEPPADAPPVCPNGLMTVTDARNHVVRCIPGRKACPAGGQLCLHTGRDREHVCCQKFLARPTAAPHRPHLPLDAGEDEVVQKVSCPPRSLAVLSASGSTVACSASLPCPAANQICYGTTKRAICCLEQVQKHLALPKTVPTMVDHSTGHDGGAAAKAAKDALKRQQGKESAKSDKRQQFLDAVQPASAVAKVSHMNDGEMVMRGQRRLKKVRKATTTTTSTTTTEAPSGSASDEYEYYYVDENGEEEIVEAPSSTTRASTTTTTTEAPSTTTKQARRRKIRTTTTAQPSESLEEEKEASYESGETIYRNRPRPQVDENAITEPQFARSRARAAKTLRAPIGVSGETRKQMAQMYIMRHIRNGWPYNENYYRPGTEQ